MKKVFFKTFGCKTNQYDTQLMREKFLRSGYEETAKELEADLVVVNTCTVTGEADRKNRSFIRRLNRLNPSAKIAVTGCYVKLNRPEIESLPGVVVAVENEEKHRFFDIVSEKIGRVCGGGEETVENAMPQESISYFGDRTRAFIKIQDGCDHACTYCKVVIVRGPSVSRPIEAILHEAGLLAANGYREVVLTGIQLGAYGDEWKNGLNLVSVLDRLSVVPGLNRIRLSSIDPSDISPELVRLMSENPKICPHLHLPLQSGSDRILRSMKRAYRRDHFLKAVAAFRAAVPDFSLTTDVMIGFPGETEEDFQETVKVLEETLPLKSHIFPYSAREGTQAASFKNVVDGSLIRERSERLHEAAGRFAAEYQKSFIGRSLEIIPETEAEGILEGHTANYLKVSVEAAPSLLKQVLPVKLVDFRNGIFLGHHVTN